MNIIFIMIPMAIALIAMAVAFFFWATNNKQFDDLDSPAYRILLDDERDAVMKSAQSDPANKDASSDKTHTKT
ncbi:MAG: cbb3-type cytochrome oxidase assembly protein CcoS [Gammaproteobacteria bacterium]|nr:cbb3-type cytochrome oxidase assembly protein CcoS [Gammaproteobacteria bacterium]